jgi:hypothetical protein
MGMNGDGRTSVDERGWIDGTRWTDGCTLTDVEQNRDKSQTKGGRMLDGISQRNNATKW